MSRISPAQVLEEHLHRQLRITELCELIGVTEQTLRLKLVRAFGEAVFDLIDRVTFHNSENGFCVLRVKARGQRDLITVRAGAKSTA